MELCWRAISDIVKRIMRLEISTNSSLQMSFKFRFKGLDRIGLSYINREVIPEEGGMVGKDPAAG